MNLQAPDTTSIVGEHAVVLGASIGGLLAARALCTRFRTVTLVERDCLSLDSTYRKGVPQGRHTHAILARGVAILEAYFPGFRDALIRDGVPSADSGLHLRRISGGHRAAPCPTGREGLFVSRPLLERHVRQRVLALPNVFCLQGHRVHSLVLDDARRRVVGVNVSLGGDASDCILEADLVVDATGRASKSPAWLSSMGFERPAEQTVRVNVSYVTRCFHREPHSFGGDLGVVSAAVPPNRRAAAALAQEDSRWSVTLVGYLGAQVPTKLADFIEFARELPTRDTYDLVKAAEPIGDAIRTAYPASVRRRYEWLGRFPERYLTFGDAVCGFNPIFGQGITVAAIEATLLGQTLAQGLERAGPRFFRAISKELDVPWRIAVGNDLRFPEVQGERTLLSRVTNRYMTHFLRATAHDPTLSRAFLDVGNLMSPPGRLFSPSLMVRVLLSGVSQVGRGKPNAHGASRIGERGVGDQR